VVGDSRRSAAPAERVTAPDRQFDADDLAALAAEQRRKLFQVLLTESGALVDQVYRAGDHDELVLTQTPGWREQRVRARIYYREVTPADMEALLTTVQAEGDAEGLLIATEGVARNVQERPPVGLLEPSELIRRLERSVLVAWPNRQPEPAYERIETLRDLQAQGALDPVGLRWLPVLSYNELPADYPDPAAKPEDVFEQMAFRLLTHVFRFSGERHGEAERGARLPDAHLRWPDYAAEDYAALLDCKASADGYRMSSDHVLRFVGYVDALRSRIEGEGYELRYLIILSSAFPGDSGPRGAFAGRHGEIQERARVHLAYVRAPDLARAAARVQAADLSPAVRDAISWSSILDAGLVGSEHFDQALSQVGA
jgi:hypothetical protein